jgi:hypothetical protein
MCTAKVKGYDVSGIVTWSYSVTLLNSVQSGISMPKGTTCVLAKGSCSVLITGTSKGVVNLGAVYGGDPNNTGSVGTSSKGKSVVQVTVTPKITGKG